MYSNFLPVVLALDDVLRCTLLGIAFSGPIMPCPSVGQVPLVTCFIDGPIARSFFAVAVTAASPPTRPDQDQYFTPPLPLPSLTLFDPRPIYPT